MIEAGEVLTLSNNKVYSVVSSVNYEDNNYVYLIDQDDYSNIMFCRFDEENNELVEVKDSKLLEKLINLVSEELK